MLDCISEQALWRHLCTLQGLKRTYGQYACTAACCRATSLTDFWLLSCSGVLPGLGAALFICQLHMPASQNLAASSTPADPYAAVQMLERQRTRARSGGGDLPAAIALKRTPASSKQKASNLQAGTRPAVSGDGASDGAGPGGAKDGSVAGTDAASMKGDLEKGAAADHHKGELQPPCLLALPCSAMFTSHHVCTVACSKARVWIVGPQSTRAEASCADAAFLAASCSLLHAAAPCWHALFHGMRVTRKYGTSHMRVRYKCVYKLPHRCAHCTHSSMPPLHLLACCYRPTQVSSARVA